MEEKPTYGKTTVGFGTKDQRELNITNFARARWEDNRICSVLEIEDGSIQLAVENISSSGRAPLQVIWLSHESAIGLISTALLYCAAKGIDLAAEALKISESEDIEITLTPELSEKAKADKMFKND